MSHIERCRVWIATWWYGVWLEYHGVAIRRRRELRRELRANLVEASAARSAREAINDLGGVRVLATAVAQSGVRRPRWQIAAIAAAVTLAIVLNVEFIAALNYVDGVIDSGGGAVTGAVFPFPGSSVSHVPRASGFAVEISPGWLPLALALLMFVLVARPWRLLRTSMRARVGVERD